MTVSLHHLARESAVTLVDTPYGFSAHELSLDADEMWFHDRIMTAALGNVGVQGSLDEFDRFQDYGTRDHGYRTGHLMAALVVRAGFPFRDAVMGTEAALVHDVGKATEEGQAVVRSPLTFEQAPSLLTVMRQHPLESSRLFDRHGLGKNHQTIAANHHASQIDRPAYGPGEPIMAVPEADGYIPLTVELAKLLPVADTYDALSVAPSVSGRNYLAEVSRARALGAVSRLNVPDKFKRLLVDVTR